ncbi:MAG: DMT family transporter [Proteobacteria bacterium]|nr:DMT family transporter [Pseudomonadota bacterium]
MTRDGLAAVLPGVAAALAFGVSNVLGKVAFQDGADVLALVAFRSVLGIGLLWGWLRLGPPAPRHSRRARWIALGLGVLFAANVYGVFGAIRVIPVPVAVLAYFIYPLLTGIGAALTGLERLSWQGALAALVAFAGLALMIGAQPGELAVAGLLFAFGAALCRTAMLLITRASLTGADPRLTTWYSMLSSGAVLVAACLLTREWHGPDGALGWAAFVGASVTTTIAILALFASTARIGPFRTAFLMNLEPVVSTVLSLAFLGDSISGLQLLGGAAMIAALCAFQLRR